MNDISKEGIIVSLDKKYAKIRYLCASACGHCPAREKCRPSEGLEKIIEIPVAENKNFAVGERVLISTGAQSAGLAVFFAYVLPLIVLFCALLIGNFLKWSESSSALSAILLLCLYYMILWLFRQKAGALFKIDVNKIGE